MLSNFNKIALLASLPFISLLSGCATITGSSTQPVMVDARDTQGRVLEGVKCQLTNDKGCWSSQSATPVMVRKSADDLQIVASKDGYQTSATRLVSRANAGMFGNIILGGGIGAIVDHSKGTAYNYPNSVTMVMQQDPNQRQNRRK